VAANLAEGFKRQGTKNKLQFYNMSQTSLEEVRYYLMLSRDLDYVQSVDELMGSCQEIARMLKGLMNSIRNSS
jgi:four helix bundle protein